MPYSIEPKDRRYVKGYGFLSFAKNIGKNVSSKYSQELVDSVKKSATDAIKAVSKGAIQKTAEVTGDLIGSKIQKNLQRNYIQKNCTLMRLIMKYQKKDIYLHKRDNKLLTN